MSKSEIKKPEQTLKHESSMKQERQEKEPEEKEFEITKEDVREIKKILAAIDGSRNAERALLLAMKVADKFGAEVEIFSVVPRLILPFYGPGPVGEMWLH